MDIFQAFDNIFGGQDYNLDGHQYHTEDNIFGGEDIYEDGDLIANSHGNIFSGEDFYNDDHELIATSKSNIFGGHDIFSTAHGYEGSTHPVIGGMDFFYNSGDVQSFDMNDLGNATTILGYSDPLAHVGSYIMPSILL